MSDVTQPTFEIEIVGPTDGKEVSDAPSDTLASWINDAEGIARDARAYIEVKVITEKGNTISLQTGVKPRRQR